MQENKNLNIYAVLVAASFQFFTKEYTVKPALTANSEQRPPVYNGQFDSLRTSLNLTFVRPLFQMGTFFRSQGGRCTQV
jgi:hypothetical protein